MFYVYVLRSLLNNRRYIGYTGKSPDERIEEHNRGCNKSTRKYRPFELVYTEKFEEKRDALKREKFLKSGQGRKFLNKVLLK